MSNTVRIDPEVLRRLEEHHPPRLDEHGKPVRALLMYSGGLDSTLAGLLLKMQGVDVVAINMFTGFCFTDHKRKSGQVRPDGSAYRNEAIVGAAGLQIPVDVVDAREGYLQVLTNPKHGWGSSVNPCIDCRIHMFGKAERELLDEYDAHFLATGEVIGQRPMTQLKRHLKLIEREAGLEGLIVRPLCQGHLWETIPEQKGWVDRDKLLSLTGRGRKPQIQLAKELGVLDFPQPAGGCCFLTDGSYGNRLKDTIEHLGKEELDFEDVLVLKLGRHFRLPGGNKVIVGRNEGDNQLIEGYWTLGPFLRLRDHKGPISLYIGDPASEDFTLAQRITARYGKGPEDEETAVHVLRREDVQRTEVVMPLPRGEEARWLIP